MGKGKSITIQSTVRTGHLFYMQLYNKHQSTLNSSLMETGANPTTHVMTVVYGHDSKTSLAISEFTKGLDSGCVKGEKLTALVIEASGRQSLVQEKCRDDVEE